MRVCGANLPEQERRGSISGHFLVRRRMCRGRRPRSNACHEEPRRLGCFCSLDLVQDGMPPGFESPKDGQSRQGSDSRDAAHRRPDGSKCSGLGAARWSAPGLALRRPLQKGMQVLSHRRWSHSRRRGMTTRRSRRRAITAAISGDAARSLSADLSSPCRRPRQIYLPSRCRTLRIRMLVS